MVNIVFVTLGFDFYEWNCAKCVSAWRKRGATVKVGELISWPCDRCQP